ncbi:heavy metal translocating P-type ATPase metal-binding domain-containing protein [soil metagenome]
MEIETPVDKIIYCYHCGDECRHNLILFDAKKFCCEGCKLVYDILKENELCSYYDINVSPGTSKKKPVYAEQYAFLSDEKIRQKLISFTDGKTTSVAFYIPQIHCSSCIWLLENLNRIGNGIIRSTVNFSLKEVVIIFSEQVISLRGVVEMLSSIGYEPAINLDGPEKLGKRKDRSSTYKIGIAGFCFGNIMLFSFPEYFSSGVYAETGFKGIFSYLNFALSLAVFFYCSQPFFQSALKSLKQKFLNIDVPIALGILVMFLRSSYEIFSATGAGYMDTMAGLVFFMLIGRAFQDKTYATISFDRDYKSFFPIAVMARKNGHDTSIPVSELRVNDRIIIRNGELVPADAVLIKGDANIDYSFVTGESLPVRKNEGQLIYAGGKQVGTAIELEVVKNVSQSYLTQLWNNGSIKETNGKTGFQQLVNNISHYFTITLITIAFSSLGWWTFQNDFPRGMNAFTAVLIIACPCALAISSPFTLGNILRIFGNAQFYLKNYSVIEKLAKIDTIVFDKTGTLTKTNSSKISFEGNPLNNDELKMVKSIVNHSSHPLSRMIDVSLKDIAIQEVSAFNEVSGMGISGNIFNIPVKIGSSKLTGAVNTDDLSHIKIFVSINNSVRGYFSIRNEYRESVDAVIHKLKSSGYGLAVVSGDHEGEKEYLGKLMGENVLTRFNQMPADKLRFIQTLQKQGKNVLMVGDGLNDAGALKQSDVGISISDDINNFSPACDGILNAEKFMLLPALLRISKASRMIILASFAIALIYNSIGLSFAISGHLSPVIAAILMPLSTVTIISFTTGISGLAGISGLK